MNSRRTQMLLTAVGLVILGAMEVYVPSIADTADSTKIVAKDFMFNPTPLTVKAGATVTWTNKDDIPHGIAWGGECLRQIKSDGYRRQLLLHLHHAGHRCV